MQYPVTYSQKVTSVLEPQERDLLVTQRARAALDDQRETAHRALLHQQGEFLGATHQYEAAARQKFVTILARLSEAHDYNVQMQVRQLEHEAHARISQKQRELLSRFSQEANEALEDQRQMW